MPDRDTVHPDVWLGSAEDVPGRRDEPLYAAFPRTGWPAASRPAATATVTAGRPIAAAHLVPALQQQCRQLEVVGPPALLEELGWPRHVSDAWRVSGLRAAPWRP